MLDDGVRVRVVVNGLLWNLWWFETSHTDPVGHLAPGFSSVAVRLLCAAATRLNTKTGHPCVTEVAQAVL
ncbi:hypothetical protein [Actinoplanes subtropicus]|uniref:hypothetical protein n=1 Tax=Actinoplanes subtropicus TaxID=543632 RepID=UPI0012F8BB61|nr:hypothetical protein [Actinoplanes subtropicus]